MIQTGRLTLRPYEASDAPALVRNANTPDVARMMESIALPFTEAAALSRIEARPCTDTHFTFAICETATGDVIGEIGAGGDALHPRLGYFLRPDQWGKGYATEAIAAALGHAFGTLGWFTVDADCFDDNPASARTLTRAGFVRIGSSNCSSQAREGSDGASLFRITHAHWATPVLNTPRLTLRPYRQGDAERLVALLNDAEVSQMLAPVPHPYTQEMAVQFLSGDLWKPDDAVFAIDDGTGLIGGATLVSAHDGARQVGFWLGRPYWGQGLMSDALAAMLDWTFGTERTTRVISTAFVDNLASQRVHEKAGFIPKDALERHSAARGEAVGAIGYTLERTDWQARQ